MCEVSGGTQGRWKCGKARVRYVTLNQWCGRQLLRFSVCMCEGGWRGAISSQPVNLSLDSFSPRLELSEEGGGNCQYTWSQALPLHTHTHKITNVTLITHTSVCRAGTRGTGLLNALFLSPPLSALPLWECVLKLNLIIRSDGLVECELSENLRDDVQFVW